MAKKKPSDLIAAQIHRDWLKSLPEQTGWKLSRIATEIGLAKTTLTNKVRPPRPNKTPSTLHAHTIEKIVALFEGRIEPPAVPTPGASPQSARRLTTRVGEDAVDFVAAKDDPIAAALADLIGGRNELAALLVQTRALESVGYLPGDVVLVDRSRMPANGEACYAQVQNHDGPQTVLRVLEESPPVRLLVPRTSDASLQHTLVIDRQVQLLGTLLPHRLRAA